MKGEVSFSGKVSIVHNKARRPSVWWYLRNLPAYWRSLQVELLARAGKAIGQFVPIGRLYIIHNRADGSRVNYGWVGSCKVTTSFVNYMVDNLQTETAAWGDFKYHDSGTGVGAESNGDTGLGTQATVQTGDERFAGTQVDGASANIYRSVGVLSYDGAQAITEHGLFNNTRAGGGTLMDRHVFAAINVVNTDSLTITYELTCTAEA